MDPGFTGLAPRRYHHRLWHVEGGERRTTVFRMGMWERLYRGLAGKPDARELKYAPKLSESPVQFGDRVRILPDPMTVARNLSGKIGSVYGQTTPSNTHPVVIGTPKDDYAINVFFDDLHEGYWFAEHLIELVDHGAGATITLEGVDKQWVRNADGGWEEKPQG